LALATANPLKGYFWLQKSHPKAKIQAVHPNFIRNIKDLSWSDPTRFFEKPHLIFEMGFCFTSASFSHPVLKKARRKAHGA